jgi:hypothetical protein
MRAVAAAAPRLAGVAAAPHTKALALALASARRGMDAEVQGNIVLDDELAARVATEAGSAKEAAVAAMTGWGVDPSQQMGDSARIVIQQGSPLSDSTCLSLSIADAAIGLNVVGPVEPAEVVELVRTESTSPELLATAVRYLRTLGKTVIVVRPGHSSVVIRALARHLEAAFGLAAKGLSPQVVDDALRAAGWRQGPFEMWASLRADSGLHAQLEQHGFALADVPAPAGGITPPLPGGTSIDSFLALSLATACCSLVESGATAHPEEIDVAVGVNLGFPADLGGPLQYLDWLGASRAMDAAEHLGLQVPDLLRRMALQGRTFFQPD